MDIKNLKIGDRLRNIKNPNDTLTYVITEITPLCVMSYPEGFENTPMMHMFEDIKYDYQLVLKDILKQL